jgi:hypothetical protein
MVEIINRVMVEVIHILPNYRVAEALNGDTFP